MSFLTESFSDEAKILGTTVDSMVGKCVMDTSFKNQIVTVASNTSIKIVHES